MELKICFLGGTRYIQPLDTTLAKKFRALSALGEMFVIGFSQDLRPRCFTEHAHFYLLPKLPVPVLRYAEMFTIGPFLALWLIFRHGVRMLIAQSPYEGFAVALAKKIAGWLGYKVALVVESHGDFEESLFLQRRVLFSRLYRFLMSHVAHFALSNADVLRAVSNSTRQQLERWMPGKPIFQFPTWTDIEVFLHAGAKGDGPSRSILYVGVLIPRKGVHHLVEAFSRIAADFPEAQLVILGREENPSYATELKAQVERLNLNGLVQFIGEMPQAELAIRMRRACVFVLPTYSEGLPRVVFEAMGVGIPVIATAVSGIPEVVQDGATGFLVPPGDEAALAERIRWVLEHPDEAHEMGCRGRAFAQQFFSTEAYVNGYRQLLQKAWAVLEGKE